MIGSMMRVPFRRLRRSEDGVSAIEFAVVSMFFLVLLYGIVTYGYIFGMDQSLNHAAEEGARAAIAKTTEADAIAHAKQTAYDRLTPYRPSLQMSDIAAVVENCDGGFRCIRVTITYPWGTRPIIQPFPGVPTPGQISAEAVVQLT